MYFILSIMVMKLQMSKLLILQNHELEYFGVVSQLMKTVSVFGSKLGQQIDWASLTFLWLCQLNYL